MPCLLWNEKERPHCYRKVPVLCKIKMGFQGSQVHFFFLQWMECPWTNQWNPYHFPEALFQSWPCNTDLPMENTLWVINMVKKKVIDVDWAICSCSTGRSEQRVSSGAALSQLTGIQCLAQGHFSRLLLKLSCISTVQWGAQSLINTTPTVCCLW